jgi:hypothetical protein
MSIDLLPKPTGAGGGLPVGGNANQILVKNSGTDGDASWKTDLVINANTEYGFSTSNTGSQNKTCLFNTFAAAEAAAAGGRSAKVTAKAGIYDLDFDGHTLLMADITIPAPATPFTITAKSVADYPNSGTLYLSDHGFSTLLPSNPATLVAYTGRNTGTNQFTGCTAASGAGRLFKTGMLISRPGIGEDRPVLEILNGDFLIDMPGVKLRVDDVITFDQGSEAGVYGPEIIRIGHGPRSVNDQTGTLDMMTNDVRSGQQWASVRASLQPNSTFDGNYTGLYAVDDSVLLYGDKPADLDNSRTNPKAEKKDIVTARTFGSYVKTLYSAAGVPNLVLDAPLNNTYPIDPNNASTTIATTALLSGVMEIQLATGGPAALTLKNNRIHLADDLPIQAGLIQIDDGTNKEIAYFEDVDPFTNKIYLQQRAMLGTTSPASFAAGTTIRMIMLLYVDNELLAYSKSAAGITYTIRARALNGTAAAAHAVGTPVFLVPPPGWIFFGTPYQGRIPLLRRYSNAPTTNLLVAMTGAGTYAQGTDNAAYTITGGDFSKFDLYGAVKIGSEVCTYAYRTNRKLYNVTRAVQGTTLASHTTVATISQVPIGVRLAADITTSVATQLVTNGAHFWGPTGRAKYLRVGREQMLMNSGASASAGAAISWVKTTLGAAAALGDTTITLASVTNLVDPATTSTGWAFLLLDDGTTQEIISYTGISGLTVTGVNRGYASRALAHANGIDVYQYKTLNLGGSGRGQFGTTAASTATDVGYNAGSNIDWIDGIYARKLLVTKAVHVRGLHIFCTTGTKQNYPRTISSGGVGSAGGSTGNRRSAFVGYYTTDLQITGCKMHRTEREAVKLYCSWDSKITHNEMIGCNMQGSGAGVDNIGASQDTLIAFNVMRDCRHGGIQSAGPDNPGVPRRTTFAFNHVQDMVNACWESQGSSSDCVVAYNTLISGPGRAILINSHYAKIIGNTIRHIPDFAIEIGNMSLSAGEYEVKDNDIEHCGAGIWCQSDSNNAGQYQVRRGAVQISGNKFRFLNTGQAIRIENVGVIYALEKLSTFQITNNIVKESDYQTSVSGAATTTISNGGSSVGVGATSIPVVSTASFSSVRLPIYVLIDTEVIQVTGIPDATHFTVTATTAIHVDGSSIAQYIGEKAVISLKEVHGATIMGNHILDTYDEVEAVSVLRSDRIQIGWNQFAFVPAKNGAVARPSVSVQGSDRIMIANNFSDGCAHATPIEVLFSTNTSLDSAANVNY